MREQNYLDVLVGAFGHPIAENPTGVIEQAAFRDMGLDNWSYLLIDVLPENLKDAVQGLKAFGMRGINCTIPHKIRVMEYLDEISQSAKLIGAVNTIVNQSGRLYGDNTDGKGFMMSLEENGITVDGKKIVVLGAGGAARAISVEVALAGASEIIIVNRPKNAAMGEAIVDTINRNTETTSHREDWDGPYRVPTDSDIVINATSVGLYPDVDAIPDLDLDTITRSMFVQDVIPNPTETALIREMRRRGIHCATGAGMLINQAALNTEMWTGRKPNKEVMYKALEEALR